MWVSAPGCVDVKAKMGKMGKLSSCAWVCGKGVLNSEWKSGMEER